ncbi:ribonuclease H-like domain-containing protein [Tanacetum coccineum]|uniref:Ribonuclease H-like domain-containing protein n=1 Tax=Tanacetum coccineum TaxID=301880 RepID=A0ABQ5C6I3_9ASTR
MPNSAAPNPHPNPTSTHSMVTRFYVGTNKKNHRYNCHVPTISPVPNSYTLAIKDPNWQRAMLDEYNTLIKNNTWVLVPRPPDANIVLSMWLSKHKYFAHGSLRRCQNDFLYGNLSDNVYMHQSPGFQDTRYPDHVCPLQRLYMASNRHPVHVLARIIASLHHEYSMIDLGPLTLVDTESKLGADGTPVSDGTLYRSLVDTLQYLIFTIPDLSYAVCRQYTLSHSSAEAECRGVSNAVADTSWLRNLFRELHSPLHYATIVYSVRDQVSTRQVRVLHVPSRYQYADTFTKGLPTALFDEFRPSLSVLRSPAPTAGGYQQMVHPVPIVSSRYMTSDWNSLLDLVIVREPFNLSKGNFTVTNSNGRVMFNVKGDLLSLDGTTVVAKMQKKHSLESIALRKDTFNVRVFPNVDYAFIVALVVILDQSKINKKFT